MPDSNDNVNARDGASIVWGTEIRVDGKRPEDMGLRSFDKIDIPSTRGNKWYSEGASGLGVAVANVFWPSVEKIRLPADHPHYSKAPTTPELDPALWDRMVALVRDMADRQKMFPVMGTMLAEYSGRACAIDADLPKPVDPDLIEARKLADQFAAGKSQWTGILDGKHDESPAVRHLLAAIKRGRELATPEVPHVG